jgi:hypothetical protein
MRLSERVSRFSERLLKIFPKRIFKNIEVFSLVRVSYIGLIRSPDSLVENSNVCVSTI